MKKIQSGKASYYSSRFEGKRTASGVIYIKNTYVCAHRKLAFGTKLLVRNRSNKKEVIVEVIDRGPFRKGRIIDLSWIAAIELGMIKQGVANVDVFLLDKNYTDSIQFK